ncbi:hypothetical protein QE152_g31195 [Popillia japonica]|uniref:28S ribosomal protein S9, mitochondrial n=1 Tax=Popillia japonica TaxID=7064 RepID=A0AAW1JAZ3_POPJA
MMTKKKLLSKYKFWRNSVCTFSSSGEDSNITKQAVNVAQLETKEVGKAMKAYLERAREHDEFMKQQNYEFQVGKRHLANMMGEDPETFTQQDIDNAIEYLFPSGLYEKKARPHMRPPEEVFPQRKAAEFDETGRPHHFLFYTGNPNFYKLLYDIVEQINHLNKYEDSMLRKSNKPDPNLALHATGFQWLDQHTLEKKLVEEISEKNYNSFINAMERLQSLPYSYKAKEFISAYQKPLMSRTDLSDIPKLQYDKEGRAFITVYECRRKDAKGYVTIKSPGKGKVTINNNDIRYFHDVQSREQVVAYLDGDLNVFATGAGRARRVGH